MTVFSSEENCSFLKGSVLFPLDFFEHFNAFFLMTRPETQILLVDTKYTLGSKSNGVLLNVYNVQLQQHKLT